MGEPEADEGQIHHHSGTQSKDKRWREGVQEKSLWRSAGGRMLGSGSGGCGEEGRCKKERKVLGVKSRACFYAVPCE